MLAKAVAGEANVPFFSMSGSEFVEMFVGMGASKVRDLFRQAKEKAPCIVFIDEIDAIGKKRDGQVGGNDEREQTLNQLLTEMDGFEGNNGVIILAATNRPESLDPALTRPGRFDRRVPVELPDLKGREEILRGARPQDQGRRGRGLRPDRTHGLRRIRRRACKHRQRGRARAVRDGRRFATQSDLEESIEVVIAGYQKKNAILTDKEKWTVAYHEIGHALVAALQTHSAPRAEDYHHPPHIRRARLHDAGRGGQPLPHDKRGAGKQDRHAHRRPRRRGGALRHRLHRCIQ